MLKMHGIKPRAASEKRLIHQKNKNKTNKQKHPQKTKNKPAEKIEKQSKKEERAGEQN